MRNTELGMRNERQTKDERRRTKRIPTFELFWWSGKGIGVSFQGCVKVARLIIYLIAITQLHTTILAAYRSPVLAVTGLYWPLARAARSLLTLTQFWGSFEN
jgi:hypothetical protein